MTPSTKDVEIETETTTSRTTEGHVWERSRRTVAWPVAAGVLGLAALGIGQGWPNRGSIESDLAERSSSALAGAGVPSVSVSFAGRDGTVSGTVDTEAQRRTVLDTVKSQQGVRVALDRLTVRTPGPTDTPTTPVPTATTTAPTTTPAPTPTDTATPSDTTSPSTSPTTSPTTPATTSPEPTTSAPGGTVAPSLTLTLGTKGAVLTGAVPDETTRAALVSAASGVVGEGKVVDTLTVDPKVAPDGLSSLGGVLAGLGADADATVTLADGTIALDGSVGSPEARQAALTAAEAVVGTAAKVRDGLTVREDDPTKDEQDAVRAAIAELPRITFGTGSATLTRDGRETVRNVAEILQAYPKVAVEIQGHTDDRGTSRVNRELSVARARTVLLTLRGLGVDRDRLTSKGFGEAKPAFPNSSAGNRAKNRRVVFEVKA
jgi:OOP family OmpA-OmpF porin